MWKISLLLLLSACALADDPAKSSEESAEQFRELELDDLIKNLEMRLNGQKESSKKTDEKEIYEVVTMGPMTEEEAQGFPRCPRQKAYRDPRNREAYKDYAAARSHTKKRIDFSHAEIDELRREAYGLCKEQALTGNHLSDYERQEQCYRTLLRLQNIYRVEEEQPLRPHEQFSPMKMSRHYSSSHGIDDNRHLADRLAEFALQLVRKRVDRYPCNCPQCAQASEDVATPLSIPIPTEPASPAHVEVLPKRDVPPDAAVEALAKVADAAAVVANETAKKTAEAAAAKKVGEIVSSNHFGNQFELTTCEEFERKMIMNRAMEQAAAMIRELAMKMKNQYVWRSEPDLERQVLETAIELLNKVTTGITGGNQDMLEGFKYKDADDYLSSTNVDVEEYEAVPVSNAGFDYVHPAARPDGRGLYDSIDGYGDYVNPYSRGNCERCSRYDLRMSGMCPLCKRGSKEEDRAKIYHLERTAEVPKNFFNPRRIARIH